MLWVNLECKIRNKSWVMHRALRVKLLQISEILQEEWVADNSFISKETTEHQVKINELMHDYFSRREKCDGDV